MATYLFLYIACEPETIGIKLKVVTDGATGIFLWLNLQFGKIPIQNAKYVSGHGLTAACTMRGNAATVATQDT